MTQRTLKNTLSVRGAREHDLKNADITQLRDSLCIA